MAARYVIGLTGNIASAGEDYGRGGGIYNYGGSVVIDSSTVTGNSISMDGYGGGLYNAGGTVTVKNHSSITGNTAWDGADVFNDGFLYLDSTSTIGFWDGVAPILI